MTGENIPAGYRRLDSSERAAAPRARRVGPADPAEVVSISVRVRRRPDAPELPDFAGLTPGPGRPLTLSRAEFAERYGAADGDLAQVRQFTQEHGLRVTDSDRARRTVWLSGTVAQMDRAFGVDLGRYESDTGSYRGREGHILLPAGLADIVEGVFGLDNRQMARPLIARAQTPNASLSPLTPPQVAALYDFPKGSANGQTIGLLEFGGGYLPGDIQAFFSGLGLTTPDIVNVSVDGATNSFGGGTNEDIEVALDIDVAGGIARDSKIAVYFAPWTEQGWVDAVTAAVHDAANAPSVLSISWGWAENQALGQVDWTPAAIQAVNTTFAEAALVGMTVFAASGDDGSNCQIGDGKAHVIYPASDPYVTACGGTSIENVSGSSFTEATWNDNGVTGGGISDIFGCTPQFPALPTWQAWANVPGSVNDGHHGRGVPDIAGNADPSSGYMLTINGRPDGPIGGTSAAAPAYAGLVALLNANIGEPRGQATVGYLNPALYVLQSPYVFRDVADGGSNAAGGAPGYTSVAGWDACTGEGSVRGMALLTALRGALARVGDLDGDGQDEILVSSPWGIGVLKEEGGTMTAVTMAPNGTRLGGWLLNTADNTFGPVADYDGDGRDEILVTSPWGIGFLELAGGALTSTGMAANGTFIGGWNLDTAQNQFLSLIADYDGDGATEIFVSSAWGIGVLKLSGGALTAPVVQPNGTRFGGWLLNTADNDFGPAADYDGDGMAELLVRSPWGLGILKVAGNTMAAPMMQPNGTRFGGWLLNTADNRFIASGRFAGKANAADVLVASPWGLGILQLDGTTMTAPMMQPNGTRFGGWLLNTADNVF